MKKNTVSLCLIAGQEALHIERCILSFRKYVDEISLVIAVGNQEEDGTRSIAEITCEDLGIRFIVSTYKNKFDMPHCDDFSAARQQSFDQSCGEWMMWSDCDDIIEHTEDNELYFHCLKKGLLDKYPVHAARWHISNLGNRTINRDRIVKRGHPYKWILPVHETLEVGINRTPFLAENLTIKHCPIQAESDENEHLNHIVDHQNRNLRIMEHWLPLNQGHDQYVMVLFLQMRETFDLGLIGDAKKMLDEVLKNRKKLPDDLLYECCRTAAKIAVIDRHIPSARAHLLNAIGVTPQRREAFGDLAIIELTQHNYRKMLGYTSAFIGISKPTKLDLPYNHEDHFYGWWGYSMHAGALRLNNRGEEAKVIDDTIFKNEGGKITVLHPTRCAVNRAIATHDHWIDSAFNQGGIEWIFCIDEDDVMSIQLLKMYPCAISKGKGISNALKAGIEMASGSMIYIVSDSMKVLSKSWDLLPVNDIEIEGEILLDWSKEKATEKISSFPNDLKFGQIMNDRPLNRIHSKILFGDDYVVVAKSGHATHPDFETLTENFELGWESGVSGIWAKHLLAQGKISKSDTIVTLPGRQFIYQDCFEKIITWEEFCRIKGLKYGDNYQDVNSLDTIDLAWQSEKNGMRFQPFFFGEKGRFDLETGEEKLIQSFRPLRIATALPYLCVALRYRNHNSQRNTSRNFGRELLESIRELTSLPIYLVGLGLPEYQIKDVHKVTLQEWITLCADSDMCRGIVSPLTGTVNLAWIMARPPTKFIIFPMEYCSSLDRVNCPSGMGECINFNHNHRTICKVGAEISEIVETIEEELF